MTHQWTLRELQALPEWGEAERVNFEYEVYCRGDRIPTKEDINTPHTLYLVGIVYLQ